jgi:predicted DNA-binding transcriptional regulator YafY
LPFAWQYHDFFLYRVLQFWRKNPTSVSRELQDDEVWESGLTTKKMLEMIYQALESHLLLEIEYHARSQDYKVSRRVVKPYRIEDDYLIGYCYLRHDERMFHLDRVTAMRLKPE